MRSQIPKVLHRLAGLPLLEHVIRVALELAPQAVHVVYGHGGEQVVNALTHMEVNWIEQRERLGTGHAVDQALPQVPDDATVLVLYGDVPLVNPETLRVTAALATSKSLGLITAILDDSTGYGRILRDEQGEVTGIVEEKDADEQQRGILEANMGIVATKAGCLREWLAGISNDNAQGEYYLTDVIGLAVRDGVAVHTVQPEAVEEVLGVNDRVQLAHLERHYQRQQAERLMRGGATVADPARLDIRGDVRTGQDVWIDVNVVLEGEVILGDGVRIGPNVCIRDAEIHRGTEVLANCVIEGARIGEDCRIGPFARLRPETELSEGVHIGNYVEVKKTRIGPGSKANHLTYLGDAEIGSQVNVGAGTITCNYDGANKHRTVIGDNVFVGSGVELVAPITLEPGATVGAGSTLNSDAPGDTLTVARTKAVTLRRWRRPIKKSER